MVKCNSIIYQFFFFFFFENEIGKSPVTRNMSNFLCDIILHMINQLSCPSEGPTLRKVNCVQETMALLQFYQGQGCAEINFNWKMKLN